MPAQRKFVPVFEFDSIESFIKKVLRVREGWLDKARQANEPEDDVWFRGTGRVDWELLPSAYRDKGYDESSCFETFRASLPTYVAARPQDEWGWYFLMQHYAAPTRLLDWTECALAALYFAIRPNYTRSTRPCVWMLSPGRMNALFYEEFKDDFATVIPGENGTNYWLPRRVTRDQKVDLPKEPKAWFDTNEWPIAVFPTRESPRIVAQRGTFTVHGSSPAPLEKLFLERAKGDTRGLCRFDLRLSSKRRERELDQIRQQLKTLGIDEIALFPEPESVGRELQRAFRGSVDASPPARSTARRGHRRRASR